MDNLWQNILSFFKLQFGTIDPALLLHQLAYDEKSVSKNLKKEDAGTYLEAALTALGALDEWKAEAIDAALEPLPEALEAGKRPFYGAIRVAVCGNQVSPPLGESMELLGKDAVMKRLEDAEDLAL